MSHSTPPDCEPNSTSTLPEQPGVLVVRKHHFLRALESLAECADPSWPHSEWHLCLLGFAALSTQARSRTLETPMWPRTSESGYAPFTRRTLVQQSTRLDLQPHEPRAGHVSPGPAFALAVRVLIHGEWHGVRLRCCSWEEAGDPCCLAEPICLTHSGCFDTSRLSVR
jgi:hypothetical protein